MKEKFINWLIMVSKCDTNKISDGYHTFEELYDHRVQLFISLCKEIQDSTELALHHRSARGLSTDGMHSIVWRSHKHSDGSVWSGWFILGIGFRSGEQITYHIPVKRWHDCDFVKEFDKAPPYDGHTSADVLRRLDRLP